MADRGRGARAGPTPAGRVRCVPVEPGHWPDVARLFGPKGACGGCWCMLWRLARKDFDAGRGARNRRRMKKLIEAGDYAAVVAYLDDAPVGWCAFAPRQDYPALARSRVLAPIDDREVWSVSCFFVDRRHRGAGVATALLHAAADHARALGARCLEGYPIEPKGDRAPPAFAWTGVLALFEKAGFRECGRRSPTRPIVRLEL